MSKINKEWASSNRLIKIDLQDNRQMLKEAKTAFANDMKELKAELAKNPQDWDCELIHNMALCAKDRANEIKACEYSIERLKEKQAVNLWKKYDD